MNPIKLSQQLQTTLVNYMTTTFDVNRDGLEKGLAQFIAENLNRPKALFTGPYLELTPPYKKASSLRDLIDEGVLDSKLLSLPCFKHNKPLPLDAPLYTHQEAAIRKLCTADRNVVVSSGTGSGKTEAFLIPLLNDLVQDSTPGVRAVLVYPLNALVNDQLDRLRVLLQGTDITFGRYTSELKWKADRAKAEMEQEWEEMSPDRQTLFSEYPLPNEVIGRDEIRSGRKLPQILITNYAMLEYLLIRPQDNPLFMSGRWRFVVLDEAHTYAGAKGIEVGLLVRRLKHRLGHQQGEMRCVATSATLSSDEDLDEACSFAQALFGEPFTIDDIVLGEPDYDYAGTAVELRDTPAEIYLHSRFDELIENVRHRDWVDRMDEMALLMEEIGLISNNELSWAENERPYTFLYRVLQENRRLTKLRTLMVQGGKPVEVRQIAGEIFPELDPEAQPKALYHLIELAAMARPAVDEPSLLPARYHLFARPPQGIWACLNPECADNHEGELWSKLFAAPREVCDTCAAPVYPVLVCRTCGQVYLRLYKVGREYVAVENEIQDPSKRYVTWKKFNENPALAEPPEDEEQEEEEKITTDNKIAQSPFQLCLICKQEVRKSGRCGCKTPSTAVVQLHLVEETTKNKRKGVKTKPVEHLRECGRCRSKALKQTEIATEVTISALTPLAVLTEDLYRSLPESTNENIRRKAGGGRKLLSFYDSRQGAARFAAFMQDIANQQAYRRLMLEAIGHTATPNFLPDLERMSREMLSLAFKYRILHNDPDLVRGLPRDEHYLSESKRQRLQEHMRKQLTAEITTRLRSRQALEVLGLMSVQYFEPGKEPDFTTLADRLDLSPTETRTLVEYLLDDLRRRKVITLPEGVNRDDAVFGRNVSNSRLIRGGDADSYQMRWIGKTERHSRRKLMKKVLEDKNLPADETAVTEKLGVIFDWLADSPLFDTQQLSDGYQLRHDHLFFQTAAVQWYRCNNCQRLNCRGDSLPCPHHNCHGRLRPVDVSAVGADNFHYGNLRRTTIPFRVEEHTAQLSQDKGRKYQNGFRVGHINMLSCSTTFEMGIDLGDLQAVVMSNIPPTVANYKQRAGRAGRRVSGTAFIMAWASNRPHDQAHFKTPEEIIDGRVRVPYLDVQNNIIVQRHINAILLSEFLRFCDQPHGSFDRNVGAFFDEQTPNGSYYRQFTSWLIDNRIRLSTLIQKYSLMLNEATDVEIAIQQFARDLDARGYQIYKRDADYYKQEQQSLTEKQLEALREGGEQSQIEQWGRTSSKMGTLLTQLRRKRLINYLSDKGVLPSYSFPLHVLELKIDPRATINPQLELTRNASQAIREYAPGQEVVADKRIWKSAGLDLSGKTPETFAYHICPNCNHLSLEQTAGRELATLNQPCSVCNEPSRKKRGRKNSNGREYIEPHGFVTDRKTGEPAGQYVDRPYNLMKSGLIPGQVEEEKLSPLLSVGYDRHGKLLHVNEGELGGLFNICLECGRYEPNPRARKCKNKRCGKSLSGQSSHALGFSQTTDTLHLKFSPGAHVSLPDAADNEFWISLKYALLQGAARALQIERRDIDGVLYPEKTKTGWNQTVVLYDSVPGGAGHVQRIKQKMGRVIDAALEIVACDADEDLRCEKSCYRCLREYGNQYEHHLLDRQSVQSFLHALAADLKPEIQGDVTGLRLVVASHPIEWLWKQIEHTQQEVILFLKELPLNTPTADGRTWLDMLQELLQRQVAIKLYLHTLPDVTTGSTERIRQSIHLQLLMQKGLQLYRLYETTGWTAVIDKNRENAKAIKTPNSKWIAFDNEQITLHYTHHADAVSRIHAELAQMYDAPIELTDLQPPADTRVIEVHPSRQPRREEAFFADFYAQPVQGVVVSDPYLDTEEKILNRLGGHLELANQHGRLEWVQVTTKDKRNDSQRTAVQKLKNRFSDTKIKFVTNRKVAHDRYIEITRTDGTKARVIIGVGLDFINPDGSVRETFLIFQDSVHERK